MSSPRKAIDSEKESTIFGELSAVEKLTSSLKFSIAQQIETIMHAKNDFSTLEKEAKQSTDTSNQRLLDEVKGFEGKIRSYLLTQKAEYTRFALQINQMISSSKELNSQLTLLGNRFEEFQKNVGV